MAKVKQYYGIKFPFTINNNDGFFIDLNGDLDGGVASELLHTILTQKGTRLRMPDFGTNLINFIFEQNDSVTWSEVQSEISDCVGKYVPGASIKKIDVVKDDSNDNVLYLDIRYSVVRGMTEKNNRLVVKL